MEQKKYYIGTWTLYLFFVVGVLYLSVFNRIGATEWYKSLLLESSNWGIVMIIVQITFCLGVSAWGDYLVKKANKED